MAATYRHSEFQNDREEGGGGAMAGGEHVVESDSISDAVEAEEDWMDEDEIGDDDDDNDDFVLEPGVINSSSMSYARADHENPDLAAFRAARLAEMQARSPPMSSPQSPQAPAPLEQSHLSQRMRKTTERYQSPWNTRPRTLLMQTVDGLSRREECFFDKLKRALSPETVSVLLESFLKRNNDDYPVPPAESRISVVPQILWGGKMTHSRQKDLEVYLKPPKTSAKPLATTPEEAEVAIMKPPHIAFLPYSHEGCWVMIMFMTTSSSCRTEVYDPSGCLTERQDKESVKNVLRKILSAVHGKDGETISWDCIEIPSPEHLQSSKKSSGIMAVEYAASWMKEYMEAIFGQRCFYERFLESTGSRKMSTPEPQPVTYEETPVLKQTKREVNARRVRMAKMLSLIYHDPRVEEFLDDLNRETNETESEMFCDSDAISNTEDLSDSESEYSISEYYANFQDDIESSLWDTSGEDEQNEAAAGSSEIGEDDDWCPESIAESQFPPPEGFEEELKCFMRTTNRKAPQPTPERDRQDKTRRDELLTHNEIRLFSYTPEQVGGWLLVLGPKPADPEFSG
jgi:hypothetical protein